MFYLLFSSHSSLPDLSPQDLDQLFDLRIDFKVLVKTILIIRTWFQISCNFNLPKNKCATHSITFQFRIDFKVVSNNMDF
jgi:hypothetical protein